MAEHYNFLLQKWQCSSWSGNVHIYIYTDFSVTHLIYANCIAAGYLGHQILYNESNLIEVCYKIGLCKDVIYGENT